MKWNIFRQFLWSFYDYKKVQAFRLQTTGKSIGYVFFLTLVLLLIFTASFSIHTIRALNTIDVDNLYDLPSFIIEDGVLISREEVTDRYEHIQFIPNADTMREVPTPVDQGVVFLKDKAVIVTKGQSYTFMYTLLGEGTIEKDEVLSLIDTVNSYKYFIFIILFAIYYLFTASVKFVEVSFLALLGLIFKSKINNTLRYKQLWTLAAYAVTLPTILMALIEAFHLSIPFSALLFWLISAIILYRIISLVPRRKQKG
ncbi:DUF1189 domain-containing protein [Salirhabdus salicampi]|uniref:DUF1189 domain-containing protein n=1 Tax=Salirhabdus salicampi TaxID=476102 RepID=UPI0020C5B2A0|nr:DUF1189 domain-containing protein [Salirhabdus salicampi]MCP8616877.1 DUF1189 domain-containing protein [Salirhabdus salicampi]